MKTFIQHRTFLLRTAAKMMAAFYLLCTFLMLVPEDVLAAQHYEYKEETKTVDEAGDQYAINFFIEGDCKEDWQLKCVEEQDGNLAYVYRYEGVLNPGDTIREWVKGVQAHGGACSSAFFCYTSDNRDRVEHFPGVDEDSYYSELSYTVPADAKRLVVEQSYFNAAPAPASDYEGAIDHRWTVRTSFVFTIGEEAVAPAPGGDDPGTVVPADPTGTNDGGIPFKKIILVTVIGGGAVVLITVILKAGGSGTSVAVGDDGRKIVTQGKSHKAPLETWPKTKEVTDPVTGQKKTYTQSDDGGDWIADDGGILNVNQLDNWLKDRAEQRAWIDRENEKIRNNDTAFDRVLDDMRAQEAIEQAKLDEEAKWNKYAAKHGVIDGTREDVKKALAWEQKKLLQEQDEAIGEMNYWNRATASVELMSAAADVGVNALATVTGPAGKAIQNAYVVGRNFGARWSEAYMNDSDMGEAMKRAFQDSVVDVAQNSVSKMGYKVVADFGGNAYKKALDAAEKAINDPNCTEFSLTKTVTASFAETGLGYLVDAKTAKATTQATTDYIKGQAKVINSMWKDVDAGHITQKTFEGARTILRNNGAMNAKYIKAGYAAKGEAAKKLLGLLF